MVSFFGVVITISGKLMIWQKPDSLPAVEHVERIFYLIVKVAMVLALLSILSLDQFFGLF